MIEPIGTIGLVSKLKPQIKFYAEKDLAERFAQMVQSQGCTISEGYSRVMRFILDESPPELWPIILKQTPGRAAELLAKHVLKAASGGVRVAIIPPAQNRVEEKPPKQPRGSQPKADHT